MNKQLEELFLSEDDEDVELAFLIAKKEAIHPDAFFKGVPSDKSLYGRMRYPIRMTLFDKYIHASNNDFKWIADE